MKPRPPVIVITGASGFVGRRLLEQWKEEAVIYAIARRSRKEADVPYHKNVHWVQCDIVNKETLGEVKEYIAGRGGVDYVIHLAAFYDFSNEENPEYERTNVEGTHNILEFSEGLGLQRFIFASSLAACSFPKGDDVITEASPADADNPYAVSKRKGEELVQSYCSVFSCAILRLAAVYSDWCEFAPLYKFLSTWLSRKIDSRFIGGRGRSAIPYIHANDVISCCKAIMKQNGHLGRCPVLHASPDGCTTHRELYELSTRYHFGEAVRPIGIPKLLAWPALFVRRLLRYLRLTCQEPFERLWMIHYIDRQLRVSAEKTRELLHWQTTPRYHIKRRLLFLLEKMKSHPDEWRVRNEAAMKRVTRRVNLQIYEYLLSHNEEIVGAVLNGIERDAKGVFAGYKRLNAEDFRCYISTLYNLLMATVRSGDRGLMLEYIDEIAIRRFAEGFQPDIICETLSLYSDVVIDHLLENRDFNKIHQEIYDYIGLTIQLAQDAVEDLYHGLLEKMPADRIADTPMLPDCKELQKMIRQLSAFYQISPENGAYYEDLR